MAAPYSVDLRQKIVQACESGTHSQREIAELFHVSLSFVESLLRQYRRSGGEWVPHRSGQAAMPCSMAPAATCCASGSGNRRT